MKLLNCLNQSLIIKMYIYIYIYIYIYWEVISFLTWPKFVVELKYLTPDVPSRWIMALVYVNFGLAKI